MENVHKYLLFRDAKLDVCVVRMRTIVDNTIHVQIQVVELGNLDGKQPNRVTAIGTHDNSIYSS